MSSSTVETADAPALTERQAAVLRAVVTSYVGAAAPVGSEMLSHLLPVSVSSASIRTTLAELADLGCVRKPHRSAGRVPTARGLRRFVDELLSPADLGAHERRDIAWQVEEADGDGIVQVASELLSRHTRQLGFVVTPALERVVLRHVSVVRLASDRLLLVLVSRSGAAYRRVVADAHGFAQADLDRMAALLNERVAGRTLPEVRRHLLREAAQLRREADRLLARTLDLGLQALAVDGAGGSDLVIENRVTLLEQPEFRDPERLREIFEAIESKERLLDVLDRMLEAEGVRVAFGEELDEPLLGRCALVATRYGGSAPLGFLGVIGPSRMDFRRVIPLVAHLSAVVGGKLGG